MAKLAYKPLGVLVSVIGGMLAGAAFKQTWRLVTSDDEPPRATDRRRAWREVLSAAALEGAVFGVVKAAVDRAGATGFERATGAWPG